MIIDELMNERVPWMRGDVNEGVVISTRIRLARNLDGAAFPAWAGEIERGRICQRLVDALKSVKGLPAPQCIGMGHLDGTDKAILAERRMISTELAERGEGSALVVDAAAGIAIMINEEDHLRLQAIASGMQVDEVWERLDAIDSEIEGLVDYAFSDEFGYLTACPSNLGTGMRASVMMHLPGLKLEGDVDKVIQGLERMGYIVRGMLGEGSEAHGNMFQVSNQQTLGDSEAEILTQFKMIVSEVAQHETHARRRLMQQRTHRVTDWIARACAILRNAYVLTSQETVDLLSAVRLGSELGMVTGCSATLLNEIMLLTQRGHLQKILGKRLGPDERDIRRADLVRNKLQDMVFSPLEQQQPSETKRQ